MESASRDRQHDPDFVPFEFIDADSEYRGISADFLALISKKTGLRFEPVKADIARSI